MARSRLRRALRLVLAAAALVAAATAPASATEGKRDQLVVGITQYPSTLHPAIDSMLAKAYVLGAVLRPFTAFDPKWQLVCMLCTRVPTIENGGAELEDLGDGRKGVAVTFTIRPEAVWGDGVPVTVEDVRLAWEIGRDPKSGVVAGEVFRWITRIDARDAKTFTLHYDRVHFDYNRIGDFGLVPAHLERALFEKDPSTYRNRTRYDTDPTNPGLYNGPYRIAEVVPGAQIVLERNPEWWGEPPQFRRIVVRVIENTAALESNLMSGAVDYVAGELGLSIDQALQLEKRRGDRFQVTFKPSLTYEHITLNLENPILADVRVRRALLMSLDRDTLTAQLFGGRHPVADGPVSPLDPDFAGEALRVPYDPAGAARLLDEAGWTRGAGGVRRNGKGEPLTLELMSTAGNRIRELVEQVLVSQWKAVGIDVRIRNQPARLFFGETVSRRRFPAMAMFAWVSSPGSVPRSTLHSGMIPTAAGNWSGQNAAGLSDPEMDGLIEAAERELDPAKRRREMAALQRRYVELLPALPLYWHAVPFVVPRWLHGIEPTGNQDMTTLWIEHWRAE